MGRHNQVDPTFPWRIRATQSNKTCCPQLNGVLPSDMGWCFSITYSFLHSLELLKLWESPMMRQCTGSVALHFLLYILQHCSLLFVLLLSSPSLSLPFQLIYPVAACSQSMPHHHYVRLTMLFLRKIKTPNTKTTNCFSILLNQHRNVYMVILRQTKPTSQYSSSHRSSQSMKSTPTSS